MNLFQRIASAGFLQKRGYWDSFWDREEKTGQIGNSLFARFLPPIEVPFRSEKPSCGGLGLARVKHYRRRLLRRWLRLLLRMRLAGFCIVAIPLHREVITLNRYEHRISGTLLLRDVTSFQAHQMTTAQAQTAQDIFPKSNAISQVNKLPLELRT